MKKIIVIVLVVQSFLLTIVGLQVFKNINYIKLLYRNNKAVLVRADNGENNRDAADELISFMKDQKINQDVTISKYVYIDDDNLVIYTNDLLLDGKIKLTLENNISTDMFIANYDSGSEAQIGKFYMFVPKLKITIYPLEQAQKVGVDGIYYITESDAGKIIADINNGFGYAEVYNEFSANIETYLEGSIQLIVCIGMTTLILMVVIMHYTIKSGKKIGILKMHGFGTLEIIKNILMELYQMLILVLLVGMIISGAYGSYNYGWDCIATVFKGYLLSFLLTIFINWIAILCVLFLQIKLGNIVPLIKGKRPFGVLFGTYIFLKCVFFITLIIGGINLIYQVQYLQVQYNNLDIWKKAKAVYSINLNYVGESRDSEIKLKQFYDLINQDGGFLIDAQNYVLVDGENHLYDYNAPGEESYYDPYGRTITINENYLKVNSITCNGSTESILSQIDDRDNVCNILVPFNLKKYEPKIQERFLDDFYFKKIEVENIYNKEEGILNNMPKSELALNIIYIDDNQEYFTYSNIEDDNGCKIINPIVILDTGNVDYSYYLSYLSRCVYFQYEGMDVFDYLAPLIKKADVLSEIQSVTALYDNHGKQIYNLEVSINCAVIAIVVIMGLFAIIGFVIISAYYQEKKYQIYIKKVFGFSLLQRINKFLALMFLLDIIILGAVKLYEDNTLVLAFGGVIVLTDLIAILIEGKRLDEKNFNIIIKGEH